MTILPSVLAQLAQQAHVAAIMAHDKLDPDTAALAAIAELHQRFVAAPPRERLAEPDDVPEADTRAARMAQHLAELDPATLDPAGSTDSNREPV
jgi:hypothetical protein